MPSRLRRAAALGGAAVVVVGGGGAAYAAMSSSGPSYRLATATTAAVTSTLHAVGTLTPVRQADVAFPVGGTVASVAVQAGQRVTAGQTLGALDTTALSAKVTAAKSALATAQARVAGDEAGQTAAATPAPTAASGKQPNVAGLLKQAQAALDAATKACAAAPSPSPSPTTSPTTNPTTSPTATPTATATPRPTHRTQPAGRSSCADAQQRVLAAETAALRAEQAATQQLTAGSGSSSRGGSGGSSSPVSAAQLAADRATVTADAAEVTVAEQNLAAATAVSPISGTVVTVSATPGGSLGAGSTAFVVAGLDSYQVVAPVDVSAVPELKVGQPASVSPDGSGAPLTGSVVAIGLLPSTSGSATTYPVTIGLAGPAAGLHAGGSADVTITLASARGVSVPSSAVHALGPLATVTVYAGGKTAVTRVTLGTRGPVLTQIASGLTAGQQVVLADLHQPLPANDLTPRFGGGGGLGGGLGGVGGGRGQGRAIPGARS